MHDLRQEIAGKMADRVHEKSPSRPIARRPAARNAALLARKAEGRSPANFSFSKMARSPGDLARGVVRAHEREQDHLEHDQPGDKPRRRARSGARTTRSPATAAGAFDEIAGEILDLRQADPGEDHDQTGKAEKQRELQRDLPAVAREKEPAALRAG